MDATVPLGTSCILPGSSLVGSLHHTYQTGANAGQFSAYEVLESSTPNDDERNDNDRNFYRVEKKRRLTNEQVKSLEVSYAAETKLEPERKNQLAQGLGLQPRQVAVWFQNRRARCKAKQLERDYDILKAEYDAVLLEKDRLKAEVARLNHLLNSGKGEGEGASSSYTPSTNDHIQILYATARNNNPSYHLQEHNDETLKQRVENPTTAAHFQQSSGLQSDGTNSSPVVAIKHRRSEAGDTSSESDLGDAPSYRSTPTEGYMTEQLCHQAATSKLWRAERLRSDHQQLPHHLAMKFEESILQPPDLYYANSFQNYEQGEGGSVVYFSWQQ